jgi:hypothetical protein
MNNDVWIVTTLYTYADGSSERMINSVHGRRETADASLDRRTNWDSHEVGHRRGRNGKEIVKREVDVQRWFVI